MGSYLHLRTFSPQKCRCVQPHQEAPWPRPPSRSGSSGNHTEWTDWTQKHSKRSERPGEQHTWGHQPAASRREVHSRASASPGPSLGRHPGLRELHGAQTGPLDVLLQARCGLFLTTSLPREPPRCSLGTATLSPILGPLNHLCLLLKSLLQIPEAPPCHSGLREAFLTQPEVGLPTRLAHHWACLHHVSATKMSLFDPLGEAAGVPLVHTALRARAPARPGQQPQRLEGHAHGQVPGR